MAVQPIFTTLTANLFPHCFQPLAELAGVPFVGDDQIGKLHLPSPREPSVWNDDRFLKAPFLRPEEKFVEAGMRP